MRKHRRVLLKLSGETLMGDKPFGISQEQCQALAVNLRRLHDSDTQLALVIGGGNIFRGITLAQGDFCRVAADQMGMLATVMNGLALQQALQAIGCPCTAMTALECPKVAEGYTVRRALELMQSHSLLIFVGGTGNPFFSTDTAAALRAGEIGADIILKATNVDGVYDSDPRNNGEAKKYPSISYSEVLAQNLGVMDATAVALCRANNTPVYVFNKKLLGQTSSISELLKNNLGTIIHGEK